MSGSRIIFTRFADADSAKLEPWREHRRRVIGGAGEHRRQSTDSDRLGVVWQLMSANNRELARSSDIFDDFQDARIAATEVQEFVGSHGEVVYTSDDRRGAYGWYLSVLGHKAVICSRWYSAERERRDAVLLAMKFLPEAQLASGARQFVSLPMRPKYLV
jgi:hypothetical protein